MKSYIEERAIEIAKYIIEHNATVRQTAKEFGISKSTVHIDVTMDCKDGLRGEMKIRKGRRDAAFFFLVILLCYGRKSVKIEQRKQVEESWLKLFCG